MRNEMDGPVAGGKMSMLKLDSDLNSEDVEHHPKVDQIEGEEVDDENNAQNSLSPEEPDGGVPQESKPYILSSSEQRNLNLVILIRFLVMTQPSVGLLLLSICLAGISIIRNKNSLLLFGLIIPFGLLIFSIVEISKVRMFTQSNQCKALVFNIINKMFYSTEIILLCLLQLEPTKNRLKFACLALLLFHSIFFISCLIYKKKRRLDYYVD